MKMFNLLSVLFITIFFSLTVNAQNYKLLGMKNRTKAPYKLHNPVIGSPLSGVYTIGTAGDFHTIDSAFSKLSSDGISGPVTFELIDNSYTAPATDNGYLLNGPIIGAGRKNRVKIYPAPGKNVAIEGSGAKVFSFINTSYLTIDGMALTGDTTLTIHSLYNNQYNRNEPINFYDNSSHNDVKNITVINDDYIRGAWSIGLITDSASQFAPDSNLINNNAVSGGSSGIVLLGWSSAVEPTGNKVTGNYIGSETDSLITIGMVYKYCKNTIIESNIIQNLRQNWTDNNAAQGITEISCSGTVIRSNIIHNIYDRVGPGGALGIILAGTGTVYSSSNSVYNNMIYDIHNSGGHYLTGILLQRETNPKIYFNSVYIFEKDTSDKAVDLLIQDGCTGVDIRNNILVVKGENASTITDYTYSNIISNNNDLYSGPTGFLVGTFNKLYSNLAEWQSTGLDLNSISEMPNFIDPDLHIDKSVPTNLESHGMPIAGIDVDIDGDARNSNAPDIGADEFDGTVVATGVKDEYNHPLSYVLSQNYPNPFNPSTTINYSIPKASLVTIKVYDILGREVASLVNEEKTAGSYKINFNASNLASGVYLYRITAGNFVNTKKFILMK